MHLSKGEVAGTPVMGMPLTLRAARELAANVLRQRAMGVDVAADAKARKAVRQQLVATSFGATARQFIVEHKVKRTRTRPRRWYETAALLGLYWPNEYGPAKTEPKVIPNGLAQRWAKKPLDDIDEATVLLVLDEAKRRAVPGIKPRTPGLSHSRARALHAALNIFFTWAKAERLVKATPMRELTRPEGAAARERALTPDEIRLFWQATDKVGEPFGTVCKLLLLTGARLREITGIRRSELKLSDDGTAAVDLPSNRTKNKLPFLLPLSPAALALIPANEHEIVFTTTGTTPPSSFSRAKEKLDSLMPDVGPWRVHDLRRTAVTGMHGLAYCHTMWRLV